MNNSCQHIAQAIDVALAHGNEIFTITERSKKTGKKLVYLYDPITSIVKTEIEAQCPDLRYWKWSGVPHNPAEEGYTCDKCNVVLIFPSKKTPRLS